MKSRLNQIFFSITKIIEIISQKFLFEKRLMAQLINSLFVGRYSKTLFMGTNIILRGLGRAENLKLYFHGERAVGLFTGVLGRQEILKLYFLGGVIINRGLWRQENLKLYWRG